jgi:hypothetical protein
MMTQDLIEAIARLAAVAVPATVALTSLSKIVMEWLSQRHTLKNARIAQDHQITTQYLDHALDPGVPLAIRHQLLRFLATPDKDGSRLTAWAITELQRVGGVVDEVNREVDRAEKALNAAKTTDETASAERALAKATRQQESLFRVAPVPKITAASLKAGFIQDKDLGALVMKGEDLSGVVLSFRNLQGSDFTGAILQGARFRGCNLRSSSFARSSGKGTLFCESDLRGADFSDAVLDKADLQGAHLEGANLRTAKISDCDMRATFDSTTQWPDGYDARSAGAVSTDGA